MAEPSALQTQLLLDLWMNELDTQPAENFLVPEVRDTANELVAKLRSRLWSITFAVDGTPRIK